jgi:hypothetical protein
MPPDERFIERLRLSAAASTNLHDPAAGHFAAFAGRTLYGRTVPAVPGRGGVVLW